MPEGGVRIDRGFKAPEGSAAKAVILFHPVSARLECPEPLVLGTDIDCKPASKSCTGIFARSDWLWSRPPPVSLHIPTRVYARHFTEQIVRRRSLRFMPRWNRRRPEAWYRLPAYP